MRVLSLNFGDANCASSQFRIHAYIESLARLGIEVCPTSANDFTHWHQIADFDAVIVQKKLYGLGRVRHLAKHAKRLFYDLDDAIWEPHGKPHGWLTRLRTRWRIRAITRAANLCLAANGVLAGYLGQWTKRVSVFPMCLDERVWQPMAAEATGPIRIGWSGAPGNLPYLESLTPALAEIQQRHPEVQWSALCGRAPSNREVPWNHVPWYPGCEPHVVPSFSIGLLPLPDNPFAAAKSPIKGLQYMACGVPTVATPLAATRELFVDRGAALFAATHEEWVQALERLVSDQVERRRLGREARQTFESCYGLSSQVARLASYLKGP
jgi:hypothetical protein